MNHKINRHIRVNLLEADYSPNCVRYSFTNSDWDIYRLSTPSRYKGSGIYFCTKAALSKYQRFDLHNQLKDEYES